MLGLLGSIVALGERGLTVCVVCATALLIDVEDAPDAVPACGGNR